LAHVALAAAARATAALDEVALAISRVSVDKEAVVRAAVPDRLLVLGLIVERLNAESSPVPGAMFSAALTNRGLYVDQAAAIRASLPGLDKLFFIVGFDKIVQILDPRYYDDREAALERLFRGAVFLVAPRAGHGASEIEALFERPENRRYRSRVLALPLPSCYADESSSEARASAARGLPLPPYLPPESATFVAEAQPYSPPELRPNGTSVDRYGTRLLLIERLLAQDSYPAPDEVRRLFAMALVP
jgi:nicotinic acid mononucleotide adenylyltransferase